VQDGAGQQLDVVVPLADGAACRFADGRERFRQQVVQRFVGLEAAAELAGLVTQRLVGQRLVVALQRVDLGQDGPELLDFAFGGVTAELGKPVEHEQERPWPRGLLSHYRPTANS
jgi:hypothetical protein